MSQITSFKVDSFKSNYTWRITDAIKLKKNKEFEEKSKIVHFENFPCKW